MANIKIAAKVDVLLSISNLGETSAISILIALSCPRRYFKRIITFSGSKPSGCGALTPGATLEENTSESMVKYHDY